MPSVLIVDDNLLAREGLKYLLNQEHRDLTFGEASNGKEAAARLAKRAWEVAVIEVSISGEDGYKLLQHVRRNCPGIRVLMLSQYADPAHASRSRQLRAAGYAGKNASRSEMLKAFHRVLHGKNHFVEKAQPRGDGARSTDLYASLSARERAVLKSCVAGQRVGEIAAELQLSIKTISTYKRRILNKLQLNSVAELVRHSIDHRLE